MIGTGTFFLVRRYLRFHWGKTLVLVACVTTTIALPLTVRQLVDRFEADLIARARATPLVAGARGSRFDLALHALYFKAAPPGPVSMETVHRIRDTGYARAIPLHIRFSAGGFPLVGTSLDYFDFRGLAVAAGSRLVRLGDCVLGWEVARSLALAPGDRLMSDPVNVFDIAGSYPVNLRVTGVLARSGTADDHAVFADVKTVWLVEGLAHGHMDVARNAGDDLVLSRSASNVVANAALPPYTEVTEANLDAFHFHGDPEAFPLTAVIALPFDVKAQTLLRGRFQGDNAEQILVPEAVVTELMGLVFRVKKFFDANMAVVAGSTALFLVLVVLLSVRLRRREMEVMFMLGCSRGMMARLQAGELIVILLASGALAWAVAQVAVRLAPWWMI